MDSMGLPVKTATPFTNILTNIFAEDEKYLCLAFVCLMSWTKCTPVIMAESQLLL